eukprot:CAMPEP_0183354060 /NCGR_PEP_ID=MMETSP0164_2-20130417/36534_1 /TAXON_ID=221442 /ORGANISM="Coccolithus pelagicus ssp braarudi, Strain PLY182g" /LENGTH=99 /DNA_ID=CAMNT_0025526875 /DNA_START=194 /DNA_END=493 /DNA_ORIENTATION=+
MPRSVQLRNAARVIFALFTVALLLAGRFALHERAKLLMYVGGSLAFFWCCCPCCSLELPDGHTRELRRLYDMGAPDADGDSDGGASTEQLELAPQPSQV